MIRFFGFEPKPVYLDCCKLYFKYDFIYSLYKIAGRKSSSTGSFHYITVCYARLCLQMETSFQVTTNFFLCIMSESLLYIIHSKTQIHSETKPMVHLAITFRWGSKVDGVTSNVSINIQYHSNVWGKTSIKQLTLSLK